METVEYIIKTPEGYRLSRVGFKMIMKPVTTRLKTLNDYNNHNISDLINEVFSIALKIDNNSGIVFNDKRMYKSILLSLYEIASNSKIRKMIKPYVERIVYYNGDVPKYKGVLLSELFTQRTRDDICHRGSKYIKHLIDKYGYGYNEELKEELIDTIEYLIPINMGSRYRDLIKHHTAIKVEEEAEEYLQEEFIDKYSARTILKVLREWEKTQSKCYREDKFS